MTISVDLEQSLAHVGMLDGRRRYFEQKETEARDQIVHRIAVQYRLGEVDGDDLLYVYKSLQQWQFRGLGKAWLDAGLPNVQRLQSTKTGRSNRPDGGWEGGTAFCVWPGPLLGQAVVYVLYDADNDPCYVGSSANFEQRLKSHRRTKEFTHWIAWPCANRKEAYRREDAMLREYAPYLNRKAYA